MPVVNGIGQSQATVDKQQGLRTILAQHISVCKAIIAKWHCCDRYQFIDANAGPGCNAKESCDGSPVIFLREVNRVGLGYDAVFIDIDPQHTFALRAAVSNWNHHSVMTGDNRQVIPTVIERLPEWSYGVLYTDPNGIPDFEMLAAASQHPKMEKIDILIRYAGSAVKRNQHITGMKMLDHLSPINKKFWIVREMERGDRWQWTFLLGMNWNGLKSWKSRGFHYADSPKGQQIIERLNYTNGELQQIRQPPLLPYATYDEYLKHPAFQAVRTQAIERSGGICEQCGERTVTEVHHVKYPPWGTFEKDAEWLLAVCHQCHCEFHGKDD